VQAGQPHPAAQAVAAALVQAADDGETKSFTLKLDPPDLGHIEVQMDFAKDKTLKATHIVTDKQDTLLLLQRDSHVLQKALQDSGVDSPGGGNISFALSKDGGGNNGGGQQNNSGHQNAGAQSGEENGTIIASTMNWSVDPETGTVHYSLLA
jgi:flagellar hook-length control protein FliK